MVICTTAVLEKSVPKDKGHIVSASRGEEARELEGNRGTAKDRSTTPDQFSFPYFNYCSGEDGICRCKCPCRNLMSAERYGLRFVDRPLKSRSNFS